MPFAPSQRPTFDLTRSRKYTKAFITKRRTGNLYSLSEKDCFAYDSSRLLTARNLVFALHDAKPSRRGLNAIKSEFCVEPKKDYRCP